MTSNIILNQIAQTDLSDGSRILFVRTGLGSKDITAIKAKLQGIHVEIFDSSHIFVMEKPKILDYRECSKKKGETKEEEKSRNCFRDLITLEQDRILNDLANSNNLNGRHIVFIKDGKGESAILILEKVIGR